MGAQNALRDPIAGVKGPTSNGRVGREWKRGREKGDKRDRVEKNGEEGGRVRHGFVGWTSLGLGFQKKFGPFATNRGRVCGYAERDRREGKEGMRGGRKKDLAGGREVCKHGTAVGRRLVHRQDERCVCGTGGQGQQSTAVLKIVSDLFLACDRGQVSLLALLA